MVNQTLGKVIADIQQAIKLEVASNDESAIKKTIVLNNLEATKQFRKSKCYDELIRNIRLFLTGKGWDTLIRPNEALGIIDPNNQKDSEWPQLIQNVKSATISVDNINVSCVPLNDTKQARTTAANMGDVLNSIFADNFNKKEIHKAKVESRGLPASITSVFLSDGTDFPLAQKNKIYFKNIPIDKFWWEPSSVDLNTCAFCFTGDIWTWDQLRAKAKNANGLDKQLIEQLYQACLNESVSKNMIPDVSQKLRYVQYFTDIEPEIKATDIHYKVPLYEYYERVFENDEWVVYKWYVAYGKVVVGKEKLKITALPFACLKEFNVEGSFYGRSSVEIALPNIQALMMLDAQIANAVSKNFASVYMVPQSFNVKEYETAKATGAAYIKVDDQTFSIFSNTQQMPRISPDRLDENILAFRQQLLDELQTIVGINQITLGESFGSATNGSAVNSMIAQSTSRDTDAIQEFSFYLHRLALLTVDALTNEAIQNQLTFFVPNNDAANYLKINAFEQIVIDVKDLKDNLGAIQINSEMLRASKKETNLANLMSLYQVSVQNQTNNPTQEPIIRAEDIIALLDLPNKKDILQRATTQTDFVETLETKKVIQKVTNLLQTITASQMSEDQMAALIKQEIDQEKQAALNGETAPASSIEAIQQQEQAALAEVAGTEENMFDSSLYANEMSNTQDPEVDGLGLGE